MAFYLGTIHKEFAAQPEITGWVNTYHLSASGEEEALDILQDIMLIEQAVHWSSIRFDRLAVRQDSPLAGSGRQRSVNIVGARDASGEDFLPSFCTVRVVFGDGVNRPDQKYLRLPINENEQTNGNLEAGLILSVNTDYVQPLIALSGVVSSSHVPYQTGGAQSIVQNRQRGWHRRTRPGFKRGWVAV